MDLFAVPTTPVNIYLRCDERSAQFDVRIREGREGEMGRTGRPGLKRAAESRKMAKIVNLAAVFIWGIKNKFMHR